MSEQTKMSGQIDLSIRKKTNEIGNDAFKQLLLMWPERVLGLGAMGDSQRLNFKFY